MGFYGQVVAINQRVIIQNQDAVLANTAELLGLSIESCGYKTLPEYLENLTAHA